MEKQSVDPPQHERLRVAFERYYERLVRLALGLCLRPELAEDIVQEAFVNAAAHLDEIADEAIGAYLRASVVNLWKNRLRRLAIERRHLRHRREEGRDPMSRIDEHHAIWQLLTSLSERQRACIVLRFYEDLSEREVARVLGCSSGSVKTHTRRALRKLANEVPHGA